MKIKKEKKKNLVNKPNFFLYFLAMPILKLILAVKFKRKTIKNIDGLKGPFVAVGNHACLFDVLFMLTALSPHRLNILAGKDVFTWKGFRHLTKSLGLIPKNQFSLDLQSLRIMKDCVDRGCNLGIFPEGKISLDGTNLHYMHPSIGKFLKFLDCAVVVSHEDGAFNSRPRYHKGIKYGLIAQKVYVLFTKEELQKATPVQVYNKLKEALYFNDPLFQSENKIKYSSKTPALGLDFILYQCPKCHEEYKISTNATQIICANCNNTVNYDEYGVLTPRLGSLSFDRLDIWYQSQRDTAKKIVSNDEFSFSEEVMCKASNGKEHFREVGEGVMTINGESISYIGTYDSENINLVVPLKTLSTIVVKNFTTIDLTISDILYRFTFKANKFAVKWNLMIEERYRIINKL